MHANTNASLFGIDATPGYIEVPAVIDRLSLAYPDKDLKLIIMLRSPTVRLYSGWRFAVHLATEYPENNKWAVDMIKKYTFEQYITASLDDFEACLSSTGAGSCTVPRLIQQSMYDTLIDLWLESFPSSFFCIVDQDYLRSKPSEAMSVVSDFIGLAPFDWTDRAVIMNTQTTVAHERASDLPISKGLITRLETFFEAHGQRYYDIVKAHGYHLCQPALVSECDQQ